MKQTILIIILFLLIAAKGMCQLNDPRSNEKAFRQIKHLASLSPKDWYGDNGKIVTVWPRPAAELNVTCDTLTISEPTKIQIIKIGNKYYRITPHETTLEEDHPRLMFGGSFNFTDPIYLSPNKNIIN